MKLFRKIGNPFKASDRNGEVLRDLVEASGVMTVCCASIFTFSFLFYKEVFTLHVSNESSECILLLVHTVIR